MSAIVNFLKVRLCFGVVVATSLALVSVGLVFYTREVSIYQLGLLCAASAAILLAKNH